MMEGFLRFYANEPNGSKRAEANGLQGVIDPNETIDSRGTIDIYSAGIEAHGLNPSAVLVMSEMGIDISGQSSDLVDKYLHQGIDTVITVCDHAAQVCPVFPGNAKVYHHSFPDPAKATGSQEEILNAFRATRDEISNYAREFLTSVS